MLRTWSNLNWGSRNRDRRRQAWPAAKFVMLLLVAHAFLVSGTHFHRVERGDTRALSSFDSSSIAHRTAAANSDAGAHTQCLLCRLQRGFCSELHSPSRVLLTGSQESVRCASEASLRLSGVASLTPSGRAPPLV